MKANCRHRNLRSNRHKRRQGFSIGCLVGQILLFLAVAGSSEAFAPTAPQYGNAVKSLSSTANRRTMQTSTRATSVASMEDSAVRRIPGDELLSLGVKGLATAIGGTGRAKMIWAALADGVDPFCEESEPYLTNKTSRMLYESVDPPPWQVVEEHVSTCGTRKLLIKLQDGLEVETVVIPGIAGTRSTVCVSSQIGCAKACQFCMTGKMGLVRNLTPGEILAQVFFARRTVRLKGMPPLTNAVYMGMGEPLANARAVQRSLDVLTDPHMFAMARNKISVSTVGPSPAAIRQMKEMPARLAWSVHAATDDTRRLLVPTTSHTMAELRDAFGEILRRNPKEHLFVEVVLIDGINDSPEMAKALADLLRPLPTRTSVNLLPLNDTGHPIFRSSRVEVVNEFRRILMKEGFPATIRAARGDAQSAACGQLATLARGEKTLRRERTQQQLAPNR